MRKCVGSFFFLTCNNIPNHCSCKLKVIIMTNYSTSDKHQRITYIIVHICINKFTPCLYACVESTNIFVLIFGCFPQDFRKKNENINMVIYINVSLRVPTALTMLRGIFVFFFFMFSNVFRFIFFILV